jgi:hypothetical protein
MWCPAPLSEGELHRRKLRSDKYKPPVGHLLEFYESDSLVEADEDTDAEAGIAPDTGGAVKSRRRTRSTVGKKSALAIAAAISAVKATEQKKELEEEEGCFPSGGGHSVDSDAPLVGGRVGRGGGGEGG